MGNMQHMTCNVQFVYVSSNLIDNVMLCLLGGKFFEPLEELETMS